MPVALNDNRPWRRKGAVEPRLILLVEDDFVLRSALSEMLRDEGYVVECAADGIEALRRLNRSPRPTLVLLDVMLPHMDGFAFRAAQLALPALAGIPVIVITASARNSPEELSITRTLRKPLDPGELLASIRQVFEPPAL
jgi:CheY-like chemotaxis protein